MGSPTVPLQLTEESTTEVRTQQEGRVCLPEHEVVK